MRGLRERIDMAVFAAAPDYVRLSVRLAIHPTPEQAAMARAYLREMSAMALVNRVPGDPRMAAWRAAYAAIGLGPETLPPPEALLAWADQPDGVPSQGALRDCVHGFMLCHRLPAAAYDLSAVSGDLWLRPSRGCEHYQGLGDDRPSIPPINELILADTSEQVLARHWHGAQGAATAGRPSTTDALVHIDLLPPDAADAARFAAAFQDLAETLLGARGDLRILSWEQAMVGW